MKRINTFKWLLVVFSLSILPCNGQIIPDQSLPNNSKVVIGDNEIIIEGGTEVEKNLYHSFSEFSINELDRVFLKNSEGIESIFIRVTGNEISKIDGFLKAFGSADLFFLNQNGISLGPNVSLDIGGSLIVTTAKAIKFEDGSVFSSKISQDSQSLLTISRPVGMEIVRNSGSITVENNGYILSGLIGPFEPLNITDNPEGLSVKETESIVLIGNGLNFNSGILTAKSGNISLLSISEGEVELESSSLSFIVETGKNIKTQEINLFDKSIIDASSLINSENNAGSIKIQASQLNLRGGSILVIQNEAQNQGSGNIEIYANELSLEGVGNPDGISLSSNILTTSIGSGKSGNLFISVDKLTLSDGARVGTRNYGAGGSGNVDVESTEITVQGESPVNQFLFSAISSVTFSGGNSGEVKVDSQEINIFDGGTISSVTLGEGDAGKVRVEADEILITGNATVSAPSAIAGTSFSSGNGADLEIFSTSISITNGGGITTSSIGSGNGGDINIEADNILVDGINENLDGGPISSGISSSIIPPSNLEEDFFNIDDLNRIPQSGSLKIKASNFTVSGGAVISVGNSTFGRGGNIEINSSKITVNSSQINALSFSGEGGNISFQTETLTLMKESFLSTSAGAEGNGGNININGGVVILKDSSQIRANAEFGNGGNIEINASGFLASPDSQITATSEFGVDGNVDINTNVDDLRKVLATQREIFTTEEEIIQTNCSIKIFDGENLEIKRNFPKPDNTIDFQRLLSITMVDTPLNLPVIEQEIDELTPIEGMPIVPATVMARTPSGQIILVNEARLTNNNKPEFPRTPSFCKN